MFGDVLGNRFCFRLSVTHRDTESHRFQHFYVVPPVSDGGNFVHGNAEAVDDSLNTVDFRDALLRDIVGQADGAADQVAVREFCLHRSNLFFL